MNQAKFNYLENRKKLDENRQKALQEAVLNNFIKLVIIYILDRSRKECWYYTHAIDINLLTFLY